MKLPESLLTVFSGEIEDRDGEPTIVLPQREFEIGDLEIGNSYRVAIYSQNEPNSTTPMSESVQEHSRSPVGSDPPVQEGELCEVEIEDTGEQGDGIARVGPGYVVFVSDTNIGDRVTVKITQARENFAFAEVIEEEPVSG